MSIGQESSSDFIQDRILLWSASDKRKFLSIPTTGKIIARFNKAMHFKAVGQRSMAERRTAKRAEMSQVALYSIVSDSVRSE
jgi:hypothetical protein